MPVKNDDIPVPLGCELVSYSKAEDSLTDNDNSTVFLHCIDRLDNRISCRDVILR